jgi:hypothetical protein
MRRPFLYLGVCVSITRGCQMPQLWCATSGAETVNHVTIMIDMPRGNICNHWLVVGPPYGTTDKAGLIIRRHEHKQSKCRGRYAF